MKRVLVESNPFLSFSTRRRKDVDLPDRFGERAIFDLQRKILHVLPVWARIDIRVLF